MALVLGGFISIGPGRRGLSCIHQQPVARVSATDNLPLDQVQSGFFRLDGFHFDPLVRTRK